MWGPLADSGGRGWGHAVAGGPGQQRWVPVQVGCDRGRAQPPAAETGQGRSLQVSSDQGSVPGMAWESSLHLWEVSFHHSLPQSRSGVPAEGHSSVPAC